MKLWTVQHDGNLRLFNILCCGSGTSARHEALTGEKLWVLTCFTALGCEDGRETKLAPDYVEWPDLVLVMLNLWVLLPYSYSVLLSTISCVSKTKYFLQVVSCQIVSQKLILIILSSTAMFSLKLLNSLKL
jgi:hypothetical protein